MFLDGKWWYTRSGEQRSCGPFLVLFDKTAGGEIRCCVRSVRMHQSGHFMSGSMLITSKNAKKENDRYTLPPYPHYRPYVEDGRFRIYVEGTYGDNGLPIDVDRYPGLWEILHPLPVDLTWALWKGDGWNSSGSEGPSIHQWARQRLSILRRPFMDPTEGIRQLMAKDINTNPGTREQLEAAHGVGNVWDTEELKRDFDVVGFAAPFVVVKRKSDGKEGSLSFQHHPRFYWGFE